LSREKAKKAAYVLAIDLELNQRAHFIDGKETIVPKIIEIGVTIGHLANRSIVETKRIFVNPEEGIIERITVLTGITDKMVENAPTLSGAYDQLKDFIAPYEIRLQPIEWGSGDVYTLRGELFKVGRGIGKDWCFGWTSLNVKTIVQGILDSRGVSTQGGLKTSLKKFGLKFKGEPHRAGPDAENTLLLYYHILSLFQGAKL
jgi:inhibitor of KinA sporulation pathway (predicted exonuclease)